MQKNLFGEDPTPQGFVYREDFIDPEEEADLIGRLQALPMEPYQYGEFRAKRLVFDYGPPAQAGGEHEPMPEWLEDLATRAQEFLKLEQTLNTAHLIHYAPGDPIGWHRDSPGTDIVVGISLLSACRFRLRRELPNGTWERFEVEAKPRSIYLMSGPARYQWQHSIPPVETERFSITLRSRS